jgi:hypothetical protein
VCGQRRQRAGKTERVRQPNHTGHDAEPFARVAHAKRELAQHRLAAGRVQIGFDPHRRDAGVPTATDARFYPREQCRIGAFNPRVELGLTLREDERAGFDFAHGRCKRSQRLAFRVSIRPQPGDVEVRVTERQGRAARRGALLRRPVRDAQVALRGSLRSREHQSPPHTVAGRQPRDRERAPFDLEGDIVLAGRRHEIAGRMFGIECAGDDSIDAQQRSRARPIRQAQRLGTENQFCTERHDIGRRAARFEPHRSARRRVHQNVLVISSLERSQALRAGSPVVSK